MPFWDDGGRVHVLAAEECQHPRVVALPGENHEIGLTECLKLVEVKRLHVNGEVLLHRLDP